MQQSQKFHVSLSIGVSAMALVAICGCSDDSPSAGTIPERTFLVETAETITEDIRVTIESVGTVHASEEAQIRPQVDAVIAEILFEEGSNVEQGDLLIRLDDRKAQAKLEVAQAALDSARARERLRKQRLARHKSLVAEKLISDEAYESIEAEYQEAEATVREESAAVTVAERELDEYHLTAPFSGTVGERLVDVGNYISSGTILTVLLKTDPLEVAFKAPDRHASDIRLGTQVTIATSGGENLVEGVTDFIDPRVDPATRMLSLRASVDNTGGGLRHGQFVQVSILVNERSNQVVIPEEAILSASGNTWAFIVKNGIAERREVTLGQRRPPKVEILDGISAGETIVVGGQHRLHDGVSVKSVNADEGDDAPEGG
jgi:membrane fusion protein (multidrug efflux system)